MLAAIETTSLEIANDNAAGVRAVHAPAAPHDWITGFDLRVERWLLAHAAKPSVIPEGTTEAQCAWAIRRACVMSALLGAASGVASTLAAVIAVETGGAGLAVAAPAAAMVAAAEVAARAVVHVGLAATLGKVHGEDCDPESPFGRSLLGELLRADAVEHARESEVVRDAAAVGGRELATNLRASAARG